MEFACKKDENWTHAPTLSHHLRQGCEAVHTVDHPASRPDGTTTTCASNVRGLPDGAGATIPVHHAEFYTSTRLNWPMAPAGSCRCVRSIPSAHAPLLPPAVGIGGR